MDRASKALAQLQQNSSSSSSSKSIAAATAATQSCGLWNLLGVPSEKMPPPFRELCEQLYATRNGQSLSEFVGVCMDGWEAMGGGRHPRQFVQAANRVRAKEERKPSLSTVPELESIPWAKKP
jgi:hypothetical protein